MSVVKPGDTVSVIYDGMTDNGEVFESSNDTGPLEFTVGAGQVMLEFEKQVIGMETGESKSFTLAPDVAHGRHIPDLVHTIDKKGLKEHEHIVVGMVLGLNMEKDGETHKVPATVTSVEGDQVTIDFNHPLAGKSLTYKVTVQSVQNSN